MWNLDNLFLVVFVYCYLLLGTIIHELAHALIVYLNDGSSIIYINPFTLLSYIHCYKSDPKDSIGKEIRLIFQMKNTMPSPYRKGTRFNWEILPIECEIMYYLSPTLISSVGLLIFDFVMGFIIPYNSFRLFSYLGSRIATFTGFLNLYPYDKSTDGFYLIELLHNRYPTQMKFFNNAVTKRLCFYVFYGIMALSLFDLGITYGME
jgi:hypothetical protein